MEIENILNRYNPWWYKKYDAKGIFRELYLKELEDNLKNKQIIFITGLRRVGKTTILKQFIKTLINKNITPQYILFLPMDDPFFIKWSLSELIEEFRKINSLNFEKKIYLFFDEIGYRENISQELKVINDNQNVKIYASGSNALSLRDKKAYLTGRVFNINIFPLDFSEFLKFRGISLSKEDAHLEQKYFEEYLREGGMPEYILSDNPDFITSVIEDIIYKDIAGFYNTKNTTKLKELFMLLCERVGKKISYNKIARIISIDKETVAEYISYFQDTHLFKIITKYAKTLNERTYSNKKIYIIDNGIKNVFVGFKDKGSLFENYIFNELSKKYKDIFYYYESNHEIDFIVKDKDEIAIESKYRNVEDKKTDFLMKSKFKHKILIKDYKDLLKFIEDK